MINAYRFDPDLLKSNAQNLTEIGLKCHSMINRFKKYGQKTDLQIVFIF